MKKNFLHKKINSGIFSFLSILFFAVGSFMAVSPDVVQAAACTLPKNCLVPSACAPGSAVPDTCAFPSQVCCTLDVAPIVPASAPIAIPAPSAGMANIPVPAGVTNAINSAITPNFQSLGGTGNSGLVPCGFADDPSGAVAEECQFEHFIILAKNLMNFLLFVIAVPIAAVSFAWAGWLYLSAAGNESKVKQAHEIFGYVVLGLCIALAAWLIVNALVIGLGVGSKYNFLGTT